MDKFSSKKQRNACKRSYSSFSSSEDDDDYKKGRRLKRNKPQNLTSKYQTLHYEHDNGEHSDRKTKKSSKRENFNKRRTRKCDSDESSCSSTSEAKVKSKKRKKKLKKKEKRKKEHRKKDKRKKEKDGKRIDGGGLERANEGCTEKSGNKLQMRSTDLISGPMPQDQISVEETKKRKAMVPMTKEEYEKQQSKVRRVFDPETGRNRLVKGDGEIIEEVVSYHRHKEINKLATLGDGASFEKSLGLHK